MPQWPRRTDNNFKLAGERGTAFACGAFDRGAAERKDATRWWLTDQFPSALNIVIDACTLFISFNTDFARAPQCEISGPRERQHAVAI